jgi:hypothetical protein
MPAIELPNNASAILRTRDEITERVSRLIARAYTRATGAIAKLVASGFDEKDPETWAKFADLTDSDLDDIDGYQAVLIEAMVKSWSLGDLPTADTALDLPKATFEALAQACSDAYSDAPNFEPNPDPKAPTAD